MQYMDSYFYTSPNYIKLKHLFERSSGKQITDNPIVCGVLSLSLISYALLYVHSSFAIILKRKRELVALLLLSYRRLVTVNVV